VFMLLENGSHHLTVGHIHLATIGFYVKFPGFHGGQR
jgi:hypothetical protein